MDNEDDEQLYVTIPVEDLDMMCLDSMFCQALHMAGVSDWVGYELAEELLDDMMNEETVQTLQ